MVNLCLFIEIQFNCPSALFCTTPINISIIPPSKHENYIYKRNTFTHHSSFAIIPPPSPAPPADAPTHPIFAPALAGATAGLATVLLLHPLDTLRTQLQSAQHTKFPSRRGDAIRTFRRILRHEGRAGLYKGGFTAAIGGILSWSCYFQTFQMATTVLSRPGRFDIPNHLLAGCIAGAFTSAVTNPIWVVKVRLQLQTKRVDAYSGFVNAISRIVREEGVRGLYTGIGPSMCLVSHGALQFTMYERFKLLLGGDGRRGTSVMDSLLASTGSKLVASVITYPMQVARTRMQERCADKKRYGSVDRAFMYIVRKEGYRGLYRGLFANVIRVTPQAAVTFITYEQVLKLCAYNN